MTSISADTSAVITDGKTADLTVARTLKLAKDSIVVNRDYCHYALFQAWNRAGVFFVTRLKDSAQYKVVLDKYLIKRRNIRADQFIRLQGLPRNNAAPP